MTFTDLPINIYTRLAMYSSDIEYPRGIFWMARLNHITGTVVRKVQLQHSSIGTVSNLIKNLSFIFNSLFLTF